MANTVGQPSFGESKTKPASEQFRTAGPDTATGASVRQRPRGSSGYGAARLLGVIVREARGFVRQSLRALKLRRDRVHALGLSTIEGSSPIDHLFLVHCGTLAGLALMLHPRRRRYRKLAAMHLAVAAGVLALAAVHRRTGSKSAGFLRLTYPLLLLAPMHYWGLGLALVACPRFLDDSVVGLDRRIFRRDLYVLFPKSFDGGFARELMNAAYFSFYPMIAGVALSTWLWRRKRMPEAMFTFTLCMYGHFLFFSLVPVIGPTRMRKKLFRGRKRLFETLVFTAIEHGNRDGGAFPSSHVAGAVVLTSIASRLFGRRIGRFMRVLTGMLSLSTVYTAMHYPIDVLAGLATGLGIAHLGPRIHRRWRRGRSEELLLAPGDLAGGDYIQP